MPVGEIWAWALSGAATGLVATRRRWWLGLVSLPVAAFGPLRALLEFYDPDVGPAIMREAGAGYGTHAFGAMVIVVAVHAVGWIMRYRPSKTPEGANKVSGRRVYLPLKRIPSVFTC